jgi:prepilin-type N-terminal cleavage/methylation domain-containing protein
MRVNPIESRKGFTLIELIMVLVIITALAALVIPIVDYIRRTSDKASASFAISQVSESVGLFKILENTYPAGMDTMVDVDGVSAAANLNSNVDKKASLGNLTATEYKKFDDLIPNVMLHDSAGAIYRNYQGNSGNTRVASVKSDGTGHNTFWIIDDEAIIDSVYPGASVNLAGVFPNLVDNAGVITTSYGSDGAQGGTGAAADQTARLIILGIGPNCEMVGKNMVSAPNYTNVDGSKQYDRFLAMFAVYGGSKRNVRPQLKGALDSTLDFLNQEIIEVFENTQD